MLPEQCFNYELPDARIAQRPIYPYDRARMMVIDRKGSALSDYAFTDITKFINKKDLLVFNNTKVIPARLFGKTEHGGDIEILRLSARASDLWWCIARPLKKFKVGAVLTFSPELTGQVVERDGDTKVLIKFIANDVGAALEQCGLMPIPPYIRNGHSDESDRQDYQSIFAQYQGSVAAPTASLHFTKDLIAEIQAIGCNITQVTLHVGPASFLPLWRPGQDDKLTPPATEQCVYSQRFIKDALATKQQGGRVIAVGTTVVRAIESMFRAENIDDSALFETSLFIHPGYKFSLVDSIVTNFHQPQSTHLLLVEAFMGRSLLEQSYSRAINGEYRFLSYGDGMLIL